MRISNWSSDVCSSDLLDPVAHGRHVVGEAVVHERHDAQIPTRLAARTLGQQLEDRGILGRHVRGRVLEEASHLVNEQEQATTGLLTHGASERSEEHTSELQSLMRNSYAGFCLKKTTRR